MINVTDMAKEIAGGIQAKGRGYIAFGPDYPGHGFVTALRSDIGKPLREILSTKYDVVIIEDTSFNPPIPSIAKKRDVDLQYLLIR